MLSDGTQEKHDDAALTRLLCRIRAARNAFLFGNTSCGGER